jgi:hypothetical protein
VNEEEILGLFVREGTKWVSSQRSKHRAQGHPLAQPHRDHFAAFFPRALIDSIVVDVVPEIENPGFYPVLDGQDIPRPFDFRSMAGITFVDTVCISTSRVSESPGDPLGLLFHECVHAAQYHSTASCGVYAPLCTRLGGKWPLLAHPA